MQRSFLVAGLAGPLAALAGAALAADPSITVSPQPAGASVTIDEVTIPSDGWLVIHAMADGKPVAPASIGHAAVKAGTNTAIVVSLDAPVEAGATLLAMLHSDTGTIGTYEFGPGMTGEDKPLVMDGKPVVKPFGIR